MFEVGTGASFTAWHVMPGVEGPEGELHSHDYRLEVVLRRDELDERGMVVDLDVLDAAVEKTVERLRDQDLELVRPADAEAVTVEVLARWVHEELAAALQRESAADLAVRIYENPVAFGGYIAPISSS